jgi:hypothetical protein
MHKALLFYRLISQRKPLALLLLFLDEDGVDGREPSVYASDNFLNNHPAEKSILSHELWIIMVSPGVEAVGMTQIRRLNSFAMNELEHCSMSLGHHTCLLKPFKNVIFKKASCNPYSAILPS